MKNKAIFPIVLGFTFVVHIFPFISVPIVGGLIYSVFLSFFLSFLSFKEIYVLHLISWLITCANNYEFLMTTVTMASLETSSFLLVLFFILATPPMVLMMVGLTYIEYYINRRIFKRWYRRLSRFY